MTTKKKKAGQVNLDLSKVQLDFNKIFNLLYPIGAFYLSKQSTSPAELFGGTWEQITNKFLRAANDTGTGGSDTVAITVAQLASHTHSMDWTNAGEIEYNPTNTPLIDKFGSRSGGRAYTNNTGSNSAHNNMPAYQNIYVWHRIA